MEQSVKVVIFKNSGKEEGSRQPDYTGILELSTDHEVRKIKLVGWVNKSEKGLYYISLSPSKPRESENPPAPVQTPEGVEKTSDDSLKGDLPF